MTVFMDTQLTVFMDTHLAGGGGAVTQRALKVRTGGSQTDVPRLMGCVNFCAHRLEYR